MQSDIRLRAVFSLETGSHRAFGCQSPACGTAGLRDCGTAGLRDCGTAGLRDCGTAGLRDSDTHDNKGKRAKAEHTVKVIAYFSYPVSKAASAGWKAGSDPVYHIHERETEEVIRDAIFNILER